MTTAPPTSTEDIEELILLLLRESSRSDAISLYQEELGVGRAEAIQAVDQLARRHGLNSRVWPGVALLVAAAVCGLLALARI